MKRIILFFIFFSFTLCISAQKLTFTDLKKIYESNLSDMETYIFSKNFKYTGSCLWAGCNLKTWKDKSDGYYHIDYSICSDKNNLVYSINKETIVNSIKAEIKQYGFVYIETKEGYNIYQEEDKYTYHIYQNKTYEIQFWSGLNAGGYTHYEIRLFKK